MWLFWIFYYHSDQVHEYCYLSCIYTSSRCLSSIWFIHLPRLIDTWSNSSLSKVAARLEWDSLFFEAAWKSWHCARLLRKPLVGHLPELGSHPWDLFSCQQRVEEAWYIQDQVFPVWWIRTFRQQLSSEEEGQGSFFLQGYCGTMSTHEPWKWGMDL